jgi:hypothetical protein
LAPVCERIALAAREVVAVGEAESSRPPSRDLDEGFVARLDRIDTQVAVAVADQVAVEVVPVRLGKPRPGVNVGDDLVHG